MSETDISMLAFNFLVNYELSLSEDLRLVIFESKSRLWVLVRLSFVFNVRLLPVVSEWHCVFWPVVPCYARTCFNAQETRCLSYLMPRSYNLMVGVRYLSCLRNWHTSSLGHVHLVLLKVGWVNALVLLFSNLHIDHILHVHDLFIRESLGLKRSL